MVGCRFARLAVSSLAASAVLLGQAWAAEPVKIGIQLPLSGLTASQGQQALLGVEAALADINAQGGVLGQPLKIIVEDTESQPQAAMDGVHKLIDVDKVPIVIGEISSSRTIPTATYTLKSGHIHFGVTSTSPDLRKLGKGFYNPIATDEVMGAAAVQFASKDTGGKKKFALLVMNDAYGVGMANAMKKAITDGGGSVVSEVRYELGKTDYRAEVQRIFGASPDIVLSISWGEIARLLQKQAWELGFGEKMNKSWYSPFFSDSVSDCIPETCEGRKGLDIVPGDKVAYEALSARIKKEKGEKTEVTWYTAIGYDALRIAAAAINKADSTDQKALLEVMAPTFASYKGVSDPDMSVDADGIQTNQTFGPFIYTKGKIEPYQVP